MPLGVGFDVSKALSASYFFILNCEVYVCAHCEFSALKTRRGHPWGGVTSRCELPEMGSGN